MLNLVFLTSFYDEEESSDSSKRSKLSNQN